jgi:hypothetical protein
MNRKQLYQPLMRQLAKSGHDNRYVVDGSSRELLLRIKDLFDVFAPIGDDYRHGLWIEVPRGKPSDWASFKDVKEWGEEVNTRKEYLQYWKAEFPRESYWYFISVSQYQGHTYLHITENDHRWCIIHNDQKWDHHGIGPLDWYLEPLLNFLKVRIAEIANNIEAYNIYVEKHLPKHQRIGHIARKDLNRIVPWQRRVPRNLERAILVLKECMANEEIYRKLKAGETFNEFPVDYRAPLSDMSIRLYAKYFKVAYLAYEDHYAYLYRSNPKELKKKQTRIKKMSKLSDVDFYRRYQLGCHGEITDEMDLDSAAEFKKIAKDHYGELGLSRMDVHATDYYTPGDWLITFGISYSAYVDIGMEIAIALYDSGCPLLVYDAEKLLAILEEQDNVRLTPHTFHDYLNHHKEGSVFSLPYECYLGEVDELTREQYDEIVSLAQWNAEEQVMLDKLISLDDSVYDLIRDEVSEPQTICGILSILERKYDVVLGISNYSDHQHCYLFEHGPDKIRIEEIRKRFETVNAAMYYIISRFVEEKKRLLYMGDIT